MVIPDAFDKLAVLFDDRHELGQNMRREAAIIRQDDFGTKPKFRVITPLADVDMDRLARIALFRVEVKAETVPAEDLGHGWERCRSGGGMQGEMAETGPERISLFHPSFAPLRLGVKTSSNSRIAPVLQNTPGDFPTMLSRLIPSLID